MKTETQKLGNAIHSALLEPEKFHEQDNMLDPISYHELLLTIHCNVQEINEQTVKHTFRQIMGFKVIDAEDALARNLKGIVEEALKRRKISEGKA